MSAPLPQDLSRVDPADAWRPWEPDGKDPFDARRAAHLFRRAAFGPTPDEVKRAVRDGLGPTLDRLINGDPRAAGRQELLDDTGEQIARGDNDDTPDRLRAWWLYAMLHGGHPLREKLTLFWHNHFATSVAKVRSPLAMFRQNQLLRRHALGKFGSLLGEVSRDPAMLVWLDSNQNVKAHPNENFAREVMELFSLGVGNYTERDVREAARAFTGWHVSPDGEAFERNDADHDAGPKTVFGQTGNWDGADVLRLLLARPACARYLAGRLYRTFVSETDPPAALLDPLADRLRKTDYDVGAVVQTVLRSRLFFSEHAYRKRVKSPVEYVLGAVRAGWPGPFPPYDLVEPLAAMGQALFAPPNVKGWTGGKNWLTDATLLARLNFADRVANGPQPPGPPPAAAAGPGLPAPIPPSDIRQADVKTEVRVGDDGLERVGVDFARIPPTNIPGAAGPTPRGPEARASVPAGADALWYVRQAKAATPAAIVQAVGEQFVPDGLPDRARKKLEAFLGDPKKPVPGGRMAEVIHAVLCLPEYQLC